MTVRPAPLAQGGTRRIYYTDPTRRSFDATVVRAFEHEGRPAVILDQTAFYPTSGGQPFDVGRLGDVSVLDTVDVDDDVVHVVSEALVVGSAVHGEIDWRRRFDHMQQHTGQHVLSAAFDRLFDNRTVSFHMGADTSTIDVVREASADAIERAVDEANRIVWDDRTVAIRFVSAEEASRLPLRKEPVRAGTLRLIEIPDFDLSACGGTHVSRTGQIGLIAVIANERFKGGSRVTFVCGGRALRALCGYRDAVTGSIGVLSVPPAELPSAIERLQSEGKELRKTVGRLQESLAVHEAAQLLESAMDTGGVRYVIQVIEGWDAHGLRAMASALSRMPRVVAVLISSVTPAAIVVARSSDTSVDASALLRQLIERFGGRGGGKPDLAQGGGLNAAPEAIAAVARELLSA
jgi:alanyl-tRNA synthetase